MGARKWVVGGFLAAAVLVVALGVYAFRAKEGRERAVLESSLAVALARAESLGVPVHAAHLRTDSIPDEDNAWIELKEISDLFRDLLKEPADVTQILMISERTEFVGAAEDALPAWQVSFGLAEAAAGKKGYQPER